MFSGGFVGMMYFGIVEKLGEELLNILQTVLETVFGTSVRPLFEGAVETLLTFFMDLFWDMLVTAANMFLYNTFIQLLFLLDLLSFSFDVFTGMQTITVDATTGQKDVLFNLFFYSNGITKAFWGISVIACILCVVFTIYAVARSMMDLDGKQPVGKVLGLMGKSVLTFLLIPFVAMAGLNLAGVVMTQSARVISGQTSNSKVSMGTQIFTAVAQDATRSHSVTPEEASVELVMKLFGNSAKTTAMVINPIGAAVELSIEAVIAAGGKIANNIVAGPDSWNELSPGMKILENQVFREGYDLNTTEGNKRMQELIAAKFNNGGEDCAIATVTEFLGFGRMPYLDVGYVAEYIKPHLVHSLIGIICVVSVGIFMLMAAFVFARRIFEILLLYIVSPYFAASMPLDEGQKFKAWREQFIGKVLAGYGIVFSMRIFLLMVPVIFSARVRFVYLPILDDIIRLIILVAAISSVLKAHTLIAKIIGGESSGESEAASFGGMAFAPATYAANFVGGAMNKAAGAAANQAFSSIAQSIKKGAESNVAKMALKNKSALSAKTFSGGATRLAADGRRRRGQTVFGRPEFSRMAQDGRRKRGGTIVSQPQTRRARGGTLINSSFEASKGLKKPGGGVVFEVSPGVNLGMGSKRLGKGAGELPKNLLEKKAGTPQGTINPNFNKKPGEMNAFTGNSLNTQESTSEDIKNKALESLSASEETTGGEGVSAAYTGGGGYINSPDFGGNSPRDSIIGEIKSSGGSSASTGAAPATGGGTYAGQAAGKAAVSSGGGYSAAAYNAAIPKSARRNTYIPSGAQATQSGDSSNRLTSHFEERRKAMPSKKPPGKNE